MPTPPKPGESEKDFINRCVPVVLHDKTTDDPKQAVAICYSMWNEHKKKEQEVNQAIHEVINPTRKEEK